MSLSGVVGGVQALLDRSAGIGLLSIRGWLFISGVLMGV